MRLRLWCCDFLYVIWYVAVNILEELVGHLHDNFTLKISIHIPECMVPSPTPSTPPKNCRFDQSLISDSKFSCQQSVTKNEKDFKQQNTLNKGFRELQYHDKSTWHLNSLRQIILRYEILLLAIKVLNGINHANSYRKGSYNNQYFPYNVSERRPT